MRTFKDYLMFKEETEPSDPKSPGLKSIKSEITLGKDNEYEPFIVGNGARENLAIIVKAFGESDKVTYGPKTIDSKTPKTPGQSGSGLTQSKLKKKTIYLVGGAVRDHLRGVTPNDYDLATDATMDEMRLILKQAGFSETQPQTNVDSDYEVEGEKYQHLPKNHNSNKKFFVKGTDTKGEEFVMGVKVNGETFEVATFRKDTKGTSDGRNTQMEFTPNIEEDAARRDFTINAMYIPLTKADGPNNKLIDIHGGIHDLRNKKIKFVGNPKERLEEDQLRAPRYARFAAEYGDTETSPEVMKAIGDIKDLPALQKFVDGKSGKTKDRRKRIKDEFLKGLEKSSIDPKVYINLYKKLGLLSTVFPGMDIKMDGPDDMTDKREKHLALAWLLRKNDPDKVYEMLVDGHWDKDEAKRVRFLIGFIGFHPDVSPEDLSKYSNAFNKSGLSSGYLQGKPMGSKSHISTWAAMNRGAPNRGDDWEKSVDSFLQHVSHGEIKADPNHPDFAGTFDIDPVTQSVKGTERVGQRKSELEHNRFRSILQGKNNVNI